MEKLFEFLSPEQRLEIAVETKTPFQLARSFATFVGQFYDRTEFDALARRTRDLYAADSSERAATFQARLNRRLYDRYHAPVAWDVGPFDSAR